VGGRGHLAEVVVAARTGRGDGGGRAGRGVGRQHLGDGVAVGVVVGGGDVAVGVLGGDPLAERVVAVGGDRAGGDRAAAAGLGAHRRRGDLSQLAGLVVEVAGGVAGRVGYGGGQAALVQGPGGGQGLAVQRGAGPAVAVQGGHVGGRQGALVHLHVADLAVELPGRPPAGGLVTADGQRAAGVPGGRVGAGGGQRAVHVQAHRVGGRVEHADQVGPHVERGLGAEVGRVPGGRGGV